MKDEKLLYLWSSRKNPSGGGGVHEKPIYWGGLPEEGRLGQFSDGGGRGEGALQERGGGVFEGVVDTPMHNIVLYCVLLDPRQ